MINIIKKEKFTDNLWKLTFSDGKTTWEGMGDTEWLERKEIWQKLQDAGTDMKLVERLEELAFSNGQNSMME